MSARGNGFCRLPTRPVGFKGIFEENHVAAKSTPFRTGKTRPSFRAGRGPKIRWNPMPGPGLTTQRPRCFPERQLPRGWLARCPEEVSGPCSWLTPAWPEVSVARLATDTRNVSSDPLACDSASTRSRENARRCEHMSLPRREPQTMGVPPHSPGTWSRRPPTPHPDRRRGAVFHHPRWEARRSVC